MASLSTSKDGSRRVVAKVGGTRKTIYLGKIQRHYAETVRSNVTRLEAALQTGEMVDQATRRWLRKISPELHSKLVTNGLAEPREAAKLGLFIESYINKRNVKAGTATAMRQGKDSLTEFFGENCDPQAITPGQADDFREWLSAKYASATTARRIKHAKQFFTAMVRQAIIETSPFADVKGGNQENSDREFFVSSEATEKIIDECPSQEWRTLVALARFGGLRIPSEAVRLTWADVDRANGRLTVRSPKTERYQGKGVRIVPLFPRLREELERAYELAPDGAVFVLPTIRDPSTNLRQGLERIIYRAGLIPWPRLWQNLRSSRATELADEYPGHVGAQWLGHSEKVANAHYRQVTESHFERALNEGTQKPLSRGSEPKNRPQPTRATTRAIHPMDDNHCQTASSKKHIRAATTTSYDPLRTIVKPCETAEIGPEGFEPPTKGL